MGKRIGHDERRLIHKQLSIDVDDIVLKVVCVVGCEIGEIGEPCGIWQNGCQILDVPPAVESIDAVVIVNQIAWTLRVGTLIRLR